MTVPELAACFGHPVHRIGHLIHLLRLQAAGRSGGYLLYDTTAAERIRVALRRWEE
jgi:hypothetical protein